MIVMSIRHALSSSLGFALGSLLKANPTLRDHGLSDAQARKLAKLCLSEAAQTRFGDLSLAHLAQLAEIPLAQIYDGFDRVDLLGFVHDTLDENLAENASDILAQYSLHASTSNARHVIFDLIMRRFDAMEADRAGILSMLDWAHNKLRAQPARPAFYLRTARRILFLAGLDPRAQDPRLVPLAWTLARAERAWQNDEYGDFAQTMALLDSDLRRYERWATDFDPRKFWDHKFWDGLRRRTDGRSADQSMDADEPDRTDIAPTNGSASNRAFDPD